MYIARRGYTGEIILLCASLSYSIYGSRDITGPPRPATTPLQLDCGARWSRRADLRTTGPRRIAVNAFHFLVRRFLEEIRSQTALFRLRNTMFRLSLGGWYGHCRSLDC
jgi:hypothetical protein